MSDTPRNSTPEIDEAYEAGRRAGFTAAKSLNVPICGVNEPALGVPTAFFTRGGASYSTPDNSGFCTKPEGHDGDHGYDRQEGPFYVQHSWPRGTDARQSGTEPKDR